MESDNTAANVLASHINRKHFEEVYEGLDEVRARMKEVSQIVYEFVSSVNKR